VAANVNELFAYFKMKFYSVFIRAATAPQKFNV